jgi:hypothetical protein
MTRIKVKNEKTKIGLNLTPKQKVWSDAVLEGKTPYEAAVIAHPNATPRTQSLIGSQNKRNDKILDYLTMNALPAMKRIERMSRTSKNEMVKLKANTDIMDRAGYKAVERTQNENITLILDN